MARQFTAASSTRLTSTILPITNVPFTMACWYWLDSITDIRTLISLSDSAANNWFFRLAALSGTGAIRAQKRTPGSLTVTNDTTVGGGTGAWYHAAGTFTSTTITAYFSGSAGTPTTNTIAWQSSIDQYEFGRVVGNVDLQYHDGKIAEAGVWNVALTATEIGILAKGFSPLKVRPSALRSYVPLPGKGTTEEDRVASRSFTNSGTTAAVHVHTQRPRWAIVPRIITEVTPPDEPDVIAAPLEYSLPASRMEYTAPRSRQIEYSLPRSRMEYTAPKDNTP